MAPRAEIGRRLTAIQRELTGLYGELAEVRKAREQAYQAGYFGSGEVTGEARKAQGAHNASPSKVEELDLMGTIDGLIEERDHLRFCVKYGMEEAV